MKVVDNRKSFRKFCEIQVGDTFEVDGYLYLKCEAVEDSNCVDFQGCLHYFSAQVFVKPRPDLVVVSEEKIRPIDQFVVGASLIAWNEKKDKIRMIKFLRKLYETDLRSAKKLADAADIDYVNLPPFDSLFKHDGLTLDEAAAEYGYFLRK